MSNKLVVHL